MQRLMRRGSMQSLMGSWFWRWALLKLGDDPPTSYGRSYAVSYGSVMRAPGGHPPQLWEQFGRNLGTVSESELHPRLMGGLMEGPPGVLWGGSYGKKPSIRPALVKTSYGGLMGGGPCDETSYVDLCWLDLCFSATQ